jgi:dethiobiotin synthetase
MIIFVTGIDTDIGKTYATGYLAKKIAEDGKSVITQKFVQTGNVGMSEDLVKHREITGVGLLPEDRAGLTCPVILSYPASPHLAAAIDRTSIDTEKITAATNILAARYDVVLIEGAGGIMVPIDNDTTTLDYIKAHRLPVIVVTSPRLGSINHTLLTMEICRLNSVEVYAIVYNTFGDNDELIRDDTAKYLKQYISKHCENCKWIEIA